MKRSVFKTALSLFLAAVLLLGCLPLALAEEADPAPIIYIIGRTPIYDDPTSPDRHELADAGSDEITQAVKEALPYAAKATLLGQWDEYSDKTYEILMRFFGGYGLNENGEVADASGVTFSWSEETLPRDYRSDNPYTYYFEYDARLSPLEIADDLNDYIEAVKRVTGKNKVSIIGRCLGVNILMAYLTKYQENEAFSGIENVVFYDSSFRGIEILEAAMSGNVTIEPDAAQAFLDGYDLDLGSDTLNEILVRTLEMMRETYGMELTARFLEGFYDHVKVSLFRRFLLSTFGSTPGYWSMVFDGYDEAMDYLFGEEGAKETYAGLIAKIDAYRENVQLREEEIFSGMEAAGVEIAVVCKYGFRGYPVYENPDALGDGVTGVAKQSFGATVSDFDSSLSEKYLKQVRDAGLGNYISPDEQIDASTARFRDRTWFIKNNEHNPFWDCVNPLLNACCRVDGFNVRSNPDLPQFLYLMDRWTLVPMTAENADPNGDITHSGDEGKTFKDPFRAIAGFFSYLRDLFRMLLRALRSGELKLG